jgi:putative ABC transport system substrate-binding protein
VKRRSFITLIGGAAAAWPLAARAQQPRRVAVLIHSAANETIYQSRVAELRRSLRSLGWIEGKNLQLELTAPFASEIKEAHSRERGTGSRSVLVGTETALI